MMKLMGGLFTRKTRVRAPGRYSNPYADILSEHSSSSSSKFHPPSSRSTVQRVELKCRCVDELLEIEQQQIQEAFRIIDKNGDGKISQQELRDMWVRLGENVTEQELRLMVEEADANGDGQIDLEEFVTLNRNIGLGTEDQAEQVQNLRVAFNVADADRDGFISAADLQTVMKRLGKKATLAETSAMLRCVDSDGDGVLDYEEFEELMKSSVLASKK